MNQIKNIAILGCGWLGFPLAKHLVSKGYQVKGSKTTEEGKSLLDKNGIEGYQLNLNPKLELNDRSFFEVTTLIINIPPRRRVDIEVFHLEQFQHLIHQLKKSSIKKIILVSSTSVYADSNEEVDELCTKTPEKSSGKVLRKIESAFQKEFSWEVTILRLSGLIGGDRLPGNFLAGKKALKNGNSPVNLVHRDDCIGIIEKVLEQDIWNEVFNVSMLKHPLRKEYYKKAAENIGMEAPEFDEKEQVNFKIINSSKLREKLNYHFIYDDPFDAI